MTSDVKPTSNNSFFAKLFGAGEFFGLVFQGLLALGLVSSAAVVAFMGKLLAAGLLIACGLLMLLRIKRGRTRK